MLNNYGYLKLKLPVTGVNTDTARPASAECIIPEQLV